MPSLAPLRVLCFDVEGGYGGSSRSLYFSLKNMDSGVVSPEIICRKTGPIQAAYSAIGIPVSVESQLPSATAIARPSRTAVDMARAKWRLWRERSLLSRLGARIEEQFDLVHFNHEGFFQLADALRHRCSKPFTFHMRRVPPEHFLAKWQLRRLVGLASHIICISEVESAALQRIAANTYTSTIYNIVEDSPDFHLPIADLAGIQGLKIASVANYSWARGVDRLVDLASALKQRGRTDIRFLVAGNLSFRPSLPGEIQRYGANPTTVAEYAERAGVAEMFRFLGHIDYPYRLLATCDMLVKPARRDIPWGRDILEAMMAAKPVLTTGTVSRFVENGVTGLLMADFDANAFADSIIRLADDPVTRCQLGRAAADRVRSLCSPEGRAQDLQAIWLRVARR